ncbi:MAG: SAM-dependent methyltransferase, partial [Paracoccaceae bacterium]
GWRERVVGLKDGKMAFGLSDPLPYADPDGRFGGDPPGTFIEICPLAVLYAKELAGRLDRHGGLALLVDYGGWRSRGDTLQAMRGHAFADPLAEPGLADLTAHVDFEALADAAAPLCHSYAEQGAFLMALGMGTRAERLASRLSGARLENHLSAYRRLTDPSEMGSLFKVLGLCRPGDPPPPGFPHDT